MIIIDKNIGKKIDYTVQGAVISFNKELSLDLSKYERDFPVHLDICMNEYKMLTIGVSRKYIAEIEIPARKYIEIESEDGDNNKELLPSPFSMDKVTLILWSVED